MSRILEIIGAPGSGKSTLARGLLHDETGMVAADRIRLKRPSHLAAAVRYAAIAGPKFAGPTFAGGKRNGRRLSWNETKSLFVLDRWHTVLSHQIASTEAMIVIDQGPVFRLANMHAFGPDWMGDAAFQSWWSDMFEIWAKRLDKIVWLDADNATLLDRIRCRAKRHVLKDDPEDADKYLETFRASYQHVVRQITSRHSVGVLSIQTGGMTPEDVCKEVVRTAHQGSVNSRVE